MDNRTTVYCTEDNCLYNSDGICKKDTIVISVDGTCISKEEQLHKD